MGRGANLTQGEIIALAESAARGATAGTNGTPIYIAGERKRYIFILAVTAAASEVTDTLDVFVDWSIDGITYYNGGHFTQAVGTGGAKAYYMIFDPTAPGTAVIDATADVAAGAVRPALFGAYARARWVIVDAGGVAASFTFSVIGYAQ